MDVDLIPCMCDIAVKNVAAVRGDHIFSSVVAKSGVYAFGLDRVPCQHKASPCFGESDTIHACQPHVPCVRT